MEGGKKLEKVLLAVGFRQLEEFLEKQLRKEFLFVGTTVYREGIVRSIAQKHPDIVVIRETLDGKENIMKIIYDIRTKFPKIRIIFIAGKREPGDDLLATLVNYGIYDILHGDKIQAQEVVALIRVPNEYKAVQHLQPVPLLDEQRNKMLFEAPPSVIEEREVIREIYIEKPNVTAEKKEAPKQESERLQNQTESLKSIKTTPEKSKNEETVQPDNAHNSTEKKDALRSSGISKQKIITFLGGKSGVGNSSIAVNTAIQLAQQGAKVLYLELEDRVPSVAYWYELGQLEKGIDSILIDLEGKSMEGIEDAIITGKSLKKMESEMKNIYKKFPNSLDFLFYSHRYLSRKEEELAVNHALTKELYLYFVFQLNYDFVVIDVSAPFESPETQNALLYSNQIFITCTQDVSSVGYALYKRNEMKKRGINVANKIYYIINRFEKTELTLNRIEEWIETKKIITVPNLYSEFINANFFGIPTIIYSKNQELRQAFRQIGSIIL